MTRMSAEHASGKLRVGIMCDSTQIAAWQAETLRGMLAVEGVEIAAIILNDKTQELRKGASRFLGLFSDRLLVWKVYQRLVLNRKVESTRRVDIASLLPNVLQVKCTPNRVGKYRESLGDSDTAILADLGLDVMLRYGFGILSGKVLDVAPLGVWSFHHGDPTKFRGAPPGFWEILKRDPVTGVILQRITERLDGGIILAAAWFKTVPAYPKNLDRIYFGAAHLVSRTLKEVIARRNFLANLSPCRTEAPVYRYPDNWDMLKFLCVSFVWRVRNQFNAMFRHQQWCVGIVDAPVHCLVEGRALEKVEWLQEPKGGYLADPFLMPHADRGAGSSILAEEFDWRRGIGHIVQITGDHRRPHRTTAIRTPGHLSYPFLMEEDEKLFCIPESADQGEVSLFSYRPELQQWTAETALICDFPAIDPTVFRYDGRWWLFCTNAKEGPNEVLYCWHADELRGPWTPHLLNPIKIDVRSSRPAGTPFMLNGQLIRPAQDCSTRYGEAISVNRIIELTPETFAEEPIARLSPLTESDYPAGLHTINSNGAVTVIDGARLTFIPAEFRRAIARMLRK